MAPAVPGLHHVSAIAGDPDENAQFYVETLGLRMVKRTVNHDDTETYHLYYGDRVGTPGTNITFFPWGADARRGEFGTGQTQYTAYAIPADSVAHWSDRLADRGIDVTRSERFGETALQFSDPDGIGLELVATDGPTAGEPWPSSPVPETHQLRGFHGVTLAVPDADRAGEILTDVMDYAHEGTDGSHLRYRAAAGGPGSVVDLVETGGQGGTMGVGTVHHVAFEVPDVEAAERFKGAFEDLGLRVSEVIDRTYFTSIYVRIPGGVLFEFATPEPGFTVDEEVEQLGTSLVLPEWLEEEREAIEASLPPFEGPAYE